MEMAGRNNSLRLCERWALKICTSFLKLWWRTLRIRVAKEIEHFQRASHPHVVVFWHCNLFAIGELHRRISRSRPLVAMVSASKDGEWLAELLRRLGIPSVRGSSHRGGEHAYAAAKCSLRNGCDVAITPDGPRGPKFHCKGGALRLSMEESLPILMFQFRYSKALTLSSWDGFRIPLPFSKIDVAVHYLAPEELTALETNRQRADAVTAFL
jgi:lysophospholipid acyltransferase (LPLAT)-like uncharacterized protein